MYDAIEEIRAQLKEVRDSLGKGELTFGCREPGDAYEESEGKIRALEQRIADLEAELASFETPK